MGTEKDDSSSAVSRKRTSKGRSVGEVERKVRAEGRGNIRQCLAALEMLGEQ